MPNDEENVQPPSTVEPQSMDEKIDAVFKALAELQGAVKDLASAISAGAEAQRGVVESLSTMKSDLINTIKEIVVGLQAEAKANKEKKATPAEGEKVTVNNMPDAEHLYKGERPTETTPNVMKTNNAREVVSTILKGKVDMSEITKRLKQ